MSDSPPLPSDLATIDLAKSFLPDWARGQGAGVQTAHLAQEFGDRPERPERRDRQDRSPRQGGPGRGESRGARGPRGAGGGRRQESPRSPERRPAPLPVIEGWTVTLVPEPRGVDGLIRQIKTSAKAYPLFDVSLLVLDKPERWIAQWSPAGNDAPGIFQLQTDGSIWTSEREALAHVLTHQLDRFYRQERVAGEPPKGSFSCVAVCGLSGEILGPPNHHDYQSRLQKLHASRFANMPMDAFKSRVRMERGEEIIQKWKDDQSVKIQTYPLECPEGTEPVLLEKPTDIERHFRENHAGSLVKPVEALAITPGIAAVRSGSPAARELVRRAHEELRRFPLPLAHKLGKEMSAAGLQIFKAHDNITYVSLARPRYLDRESSPVADSLAAILDYLERHASTPRPEQWKALIDLRPAPSDGQPDTRHTAVASDLSWLLHQGHVIDYAKRGLEAVQKPKPLRQSTDSGRRSRHRSERSPESGSHPDRETQTEIPPHAPE